MHACVCVCVERETDRQTEIDSQRDRNRDRDRETECVCVCVLDREGTYWAPCLKMSVKHITMAILIIIQWKMATKQWLPSDYVTMLTVFAVCGLTFADGHFVRARLEVCTFPRGDGKALKQGHDLVTRVACQLEPCWPAAQRSPFLLVNCQDTVCPFPGNTVTCYKFSIFYQITLQCIHSSNCTNPDVKEFSHGVFMPWTWITVSRTL